MCTTYPHSGRTHRCDLVRPLELGAEGEQSSHSGCLESFSEAGRWGSVQVKAPSHLTLFRTVHAVPGVGTDQHVSPCTGHWALAVAPPSWACPLTWVVVVGDTGLAETTPPRPSELTLIETH